MIQQELLLLHSPALLIALPLLAAFITPLVSKSRPWVRNLWVVLALAFTELFAAMLYLDVFSGKVHAYRVGAELPGIASSAGFPIRVILVGDALSALVALLAISISLAAAVYSWKFMQGKEGLEKFYTLLLLLAGSMAGLALTGDFFTLFVFFEIMSISSAG
ncbi:MAG: NADH:ubiquinone oxidoreductase, partial [Candidatus Diapherotrites archaeon]|nr:NADH:ubiquinone oxidoreductase [Candidatus Diapherotrites archaeon]